MSGINRHCSRVIAVVSSFMPTRDLVAHCAQLAPQVSTIVVVDDGSDDRAESVLTELSASGVSVLRHGKNLGIGAAMNSGFEFARAHDKELVVTFDQDSSVPDGFIDALVDEYDRLNKLGHKVAMVVPEKYGQTPQSHLAIDGAYLEAVAPIQSGTLMPLTAIETLGPQRSDFFIDLIDTEYFFRAKKAGFEAACAPDLVLPHGFGHRLYVHAFGHRLSNSDGSPKMVAVSTPFRYYYRARNRVRFNWMYRNDFQTLKILLSQTLNDLILDFSVAIWSSDKKVALVSLMVRGWLDGLGGRGGKAPDWVANTASRISWKHPVETD